MISYYDMTNNNLKFVKCGNAICSIGNIVVVGSIGNLNNDSYSSIAIGTDGFPVISFTYKYTNYIDTNISNLKVAKCGNASCSSGNIITTVDSAGIVGQFDSIAIGTDGFPVISYLDNFPNYDLKFLKCGNAACSSGNTISTLDSVGYVGYYTSIAIGANGFPMISYQDFQNNDLKFLKCGNISCSSGNSITTVDSVGSTGHYTSLKKGADGLPVISYSDLTNGYLKVAR